MREPPPLTYEKNKRENRFHIQSKLTLAEYEPFMRFCKDKEFSISSALRYIIQTHPET
ncbi:MAG: hypothetical protein VW982_08150 [Candidatus Poseidoniales archaeon]|jgi:hypothetical protein